MTLWFVRRLLLLLGGGGDVITFSGFRWLGCLLVGGWVGWVGARRSWNQPMIILAYLMVESLRLMRGEYVYG